MPVSKTPKNLTNCELYYQLNQVNRITPVSALFEGLEHPMAWRLEWSEGEWVDRYCVPGSLTWRAPSPHTLLPGRIEDYFQAIHVAQTIARRFARSFDIPDGRGRWSELAKTAEGLTLLG